ncbi:MAG: ATP-dependent helicase [Bacteroidales bacterium]|nr:ATP-dependent helicase [Bacteroidales bacterium]
MMPFATDEEIRMAQSILLPGKPDFEDDKIAVIKSNVSRDIKACPGSGKTTVLLAKLSILSNRMPFADGSGICVLTHTNVAIDEIKARFGGKADLLFSYPNFCGTIQAFVDRFLAIPFFNSFSEKPISDINGERAEIIIEKEFNSKFKTFGKENRKSLYSLVDVNNYKKGDRINWDAVHEEITKIVRESHYNYTEKKFYKKYGDPKCIASDSKKPSPRFLFFNIVRRAAEWQGVLKYEDAFSLGFAYNEIVPEIRASLSKRFKYVFIDEVQDSSQLQLDLLDAVFDRDKTIVQRFGDEYQAIYNIDEACAWKPENPLQLNESKRFGESIAKVLRSLCIKDNRDLIGNKDVNSVKPIMLVYSNPLEVLPAYAKLLREKIIGEKSIADIAVNERKNDVLKRINVKAVGFVGKAKKVNDEWVSIHRYFPQFESQNTPKKPYGEIVTLNTFLQKNSLDDNPQEYRNRILDALVVTLERAGVTRDNGRRFTKTSILDHIKDLKTDASDTLKTKLSEWVLKMSNSEFKVDSDVFDSVRLYITTDFANIFGFNAGIGALRQFLKKEANAFYEVKNDQQSLNLYRDGDLEIEVATVHSVKGETHAATLFLETKYYKYESEHFGAQLCGDPYVGRAGDSHILPALKVAYVAMSRPKYLLAYAIQKERFEQLNSEKIAKIWEVIEI